MYCIYLKIYLYDVQIVVEVMSNSECSPFFFIFWIDLKEKLLSCVFTFRYICTENLSPLNMELILHLMYIIEKIHTWLYKCYSLLCLLGWLEHIDILWIYKFLFFLKFKNLAHMDLHIYCVYCIYSRHISKHLAYWVICTVVSLSFFFVIFFIVWKVQKRTALP